MGLENLPKTKWLASGEQAILKIDFIDIEDAIVSLADRFSIAPAVVWNDNTSIRVPASAELPIHLTMSGLPNPANPGFFIDAGLSDGKYRVNTSNVDVDFDTSTTFWGTEKASQWYGNYAIAGNSDTAFTLKAMPWMRVSSQATKTITLRNNPNTANIGYGFSTDELVGGVLYFLTGASKGLMRTITANNDDNTTGGTITYTGDALTVAQGDWFFVLPATNFRWIGDFYNNASSNIIKFYQTGEFVHLDAAQSWTAPHTSGTPVVTVNGPEIGFFPPLASSAWLYTSADPHGSLAPIKGASGLWPYISAGGPYLPLPIYDGNFFAQAYYDTVWSYYCGAFAYPVRFF
jgi:hypothetical protein